MPLIKDDHVVRDTHVEWSRSSFRQMDSATGARCGKDLLYPETVDASVEVRSVGLVSIPSCAKTQPF